jgi:hypothetical protein
VFGFIKFSISKRLICSLKSIKTEILSKIQGTKIVKNFKANIQSKRIELLVYDLSNDQKSYNENIAKVIKYKNIFFKKILFIIKINKIDNKNRNKAVRSPVISIPKKTRIKNKKYLT